MTEALATILSLSTEPACSKGITSETASVLLLRNGMPDMGER